MKPTLIIVEDQETVREALEKGLKADFNIVAIEGDGVQAVEACRSLRPNLVLMDIVLPRLSGIEAVQKILTGNKTPPKIVMLSGLKEEKMVRDSFMAGASDYLIKPCAMKKIGEVLRENLAPRA